jgi:hypothetical protein
MIDFNATQSWNARCSIRLSLELDSNDILERATQGEKHFTPIISTEAGTKIDCKDLQFENRPSFICCSFESESNMDRLEQRTVWKQQIVESSQSRVWLKC